MGFGFAAALASACSSSSSSAPAADTATDASPKGDDAGDAGGQGDGNQDDGGAPVADAASPATCDAVSLAPPADGGRGRVLRVPGDALHGGGRRVLHRLRVRAGLRLPRAHRHGDSLNSGYSACGEAVDALMNGNAALTGVAQCATKKCNAQCFGGGGDGG